MLKTYKSKGGTVDSSGGEIDAQATVSPLQNQRSLGALAAQFDGHGLHEGVGLAHGSGNFGQYVRWFASSASRALGENERPTLAVGEMSRKGIFTLGNRCPAEVQVDFRLE